VRLPWKQRTVRGVTMGSSCTNAEVDALCRAAAQHPGALALEVGTAYGYTTCRLAEVAHVVSVDPHGGYGTHPVPHSWPAARDNAIACGLEHRITFIHGRSEHVLPTLLDIGARFHLAFVDGDHIEATVYADLTHSWALLSEGGTLAAHDYHEDTCPGVAPAIDRFARGLHPNTNASLHVDTLWTADKPTVTATAT
jgi:predicted O-methyltransferase YrrM